MSTAAAIDEVTNNCLSCAGPKNSSPGASVASELSAASRP
jgi:hypothetical protein